MPTAEPILDQIFIRECPLPEWSDGKHGIAILLSDWARENAKNSLLGVVEAVGPGVINQAGVALPMSVRPGDVVWYAKWNDAKACHYYLPWDAQVIILRPHDVLAVDDSPEAQEAKRRMYEQLANPSGLGWPSLGRT